MRAAVGMNKGKEKTIRKRVQKQLMKREGDTALLNQPHSRDSDTQRLLEDWAVWAAMNVKIDICACRALTVHGFQTLFRGHSHCVISAHESVWTVNGCDGPTI